MSTRQVQLISDAIATSELLNSAISALQDEAGKQEDSEGSFATEFPAALEANRSALNALRDALEALYDAVKHVQRLIESEEAPEGAYEDVDCATDDLRQAYRAYQEGRMHTARLYVQWSTRNGVILDDMSSDLVQAWRNHAFHEGDVIDHVCLLLGIPIE